MSNRKSLYRKLLPIVLFLLVCPLAGCGHSSSSETKAEVPALSQEEIDRYVSEDGYVDPAAYGAIGDGSTDDSDAIQMAIDSGYNVRLQDVTYFIAADKYLTISDKTDFHMEGGTIHKEASSSNYNLFVLKDLKDCSFSDMSIYSEFTCKDILIPKDHMRPEETKNSNVLAFSGTGNSNILFKNNTFDHMGADYWFNATEDAFWQDITVDGWESSTSLMPMYTQCVTGLTVKNADVSLNPGCGDGDHCMYVCYKSSDILIQDCSFTGNGSSDLNGAVVVLTFHGGNEKKDTQPKNIRIQSCTIDAQQGRALYCEEGTDITVVDSSVRQGAAEQNSQENQEDSKLVLTYEQTPVFGYGSFCFENCVIQTVDTAFEGMDSLVLNNCQVSGAVEHALITGVANLQATETDFMINGGAALYMNESSHPVHVYDTCTFVKKGDALAYLFSDRSSDGSITLKNSKVDLNGNWFSYDGAEKTDFTYVLENTEICNSLGNSMGE